MRLSLVQHQKQGHEIDEIKCSYPGVSCGEDAVLEKIGMDYIGLSR